MGGPSLANDEKKILDKRFSYKVSLEVFCIPISDTRFLTLFDKCLQFCATALCPRLKMKIKNSCGQAAYRPGTGENTQTSTC